MLIFLLALQLSQIDAHDLVERSIAYHDPDGAWEMLEHTFRIRETRPDGTARHLEVTIDHPGERFIYDAMIDDDRVVKRLIRGECSAVVNGSSEISEELAERYRTSCDAIRSYRNYYDYLLGMPMKLRDDGVIIDPTVGSTVFNEQRVLQVRVTYDESVGSDTWYYYFDPQSYRLVGVRFYHDEAKRDGEMIIFEDEVSIDGMRIPQHRRWYMNLDERFIGADTVLE